MTTVRQQWHRDICATFAGIINRLQARPLVLGADELFLVSEKLLLWLPIDRDGVGLMYIWKEPGGGFQMHDLAAFLARRANGKITVDLPPPSMGREEIRAGAQWHVRALVAVGQDVLAGDQRWIAEWESAGVRRFPLPPEFQAELQKNLADAGI